MLGLALELSMKSVSRSVFGGFVFVVDCAAEGAAHDYVATGHAAAAAPGSRFAYHCFKDDNVQSIQETANAWVARAER